MKTEPGNFYLGVIDLFSIILPGALLVYFLPDWQGSAAFGALLQKPGKEAHEWLVFLFPAYLFGHIVFLLSSFLDKLYDDWIRPYYWPEIGERAYLLAEVIKEKSIGDGNTRAVNTFQWAKSVLMLNHPEAASEVARLEAASKFFRSLVVVLAILVVMNIRMSAGDWQVALLLMVLVGLSLWRYAERRHKSVKQACWFVISMDGMARQEAANGSIVPKTTHAGGVVYRMKDSRVEYLLVRPKTRANEWLLPKGHLEHGESPEEAVGREIREEAGVVAEIISRLGRIHFHVKNETVVAEFYLMQWVKQANSEEDRQVLWCSAAEAMQRLSFAKYRNLLAMAEKKRHDSSKKTGTEREARPK